MRSVTNHCEVERETNFTVSPGTWNVIVVPSQVLVDTKFADAVDSVVTLLAVEVAIEVIVFVTPERRGASSNHVVIGPVELPSVVSP